MEQLSFFGEPVPIEKKYQKQTDLFFLYDFAKEQSLLHWGREFNIEIELVNRLWHKTNGMFIRDLEKNKIWIRMSKKTNARRTLENVKGTLLHELVHWHLYTSGLPFRDSDERFAEECLRVGAPFSGSKIAQLTAQRVMKNKKAPKP